MVTTERDLFLIYLGILFAISATSYVILRLRRDLRERATIRPRRPTHSPRISRISRIHR